MSSKPHKSHLPTAILTQRYTQLQDWLQETNQNQANNLTMLAGDASFRCYYRLTNDKGSFVVMDAPPDKESCASFVKVANILHKVGINAPKIYLQDLARGFLLLSDLGDRLYLSELSADNVETLYSHAFDTLLTMQQISVNQYELPHYTEDFLRQEMNLFLEWYLVKYKKIALSVRAQHDIEKAFNKLIESATQQPQVFVHRDFHSRNLLVLDTENVGVLDFQDAVSGPITYDLVSLLKDCYIDWPQQQIQTWVLRYRDQLKAEGILTQVSAEEFMHWFDWMGLQRHLKCLGIFSRLYLRDQKPGYLAEIPRVLNYAASVCQRYKELSVLTPYLQSA